MKFLSDKKIKVLHLMTHAAVGGAQDNTLCTCERHDRSRYEVHLGCNPAGGWSERARQSCDVFHPLPSLVTPVRPLEDLRALLGILHLLRREKFDLIHTHTAKAGFLGRLAAGLGGVPVVVHTYHAFPFHDFMPAWKRRLYVMLERLVCSMTDFVITLSEQSRQEGQRLGIAPERAAQVVYTGIDFQKLDDGVDRETMRARLDLAPDQPVVILVGRLEPAKAPLLMVEAFCRVMQSHPNAVLLLAGDGELRGEVEGKVRSLGLERQIRLLGTRSDVPDLLRAADVFAFSSLWEAMGRALVEAMLLGRAVVAPAIYGIPEIVHHEETGLLYEVGQVDQLAESIGRLLSDSAERQRLGAGAQRLTRHLFDVRQMVNSIEQIYERLLPAGSPAADINPTANAGGTWNAERRTRNAGGGMRNSKPETRNAERGVLTVDGLAFQGARWLMLATLVFTPWAYAGIPDWTIETINGMLAGVLVLWIFGGLLRQSLPSVPRLLACGAVTLVVYAWFAALNAKSDFHEGSREWIELTPWFSWLPGTVNQSASFTVARRVTALLFAVCFVYDMARRTLWRERLLRTVAINGAVFVLFGLVQRLADAPGVFWSNDDYGRSFFATYRYHSNAGAFINLVWPIVAGFVALAFLRASSLKLRLGWGTALVVCLAGVLVNASRAAGVLALLLGAAWIGWLVWQAWRGRLPGVPLSGAAVGGGLLLLLIIALAVTAGLDTTARRWGKFERELTATNPRLEVVRACLEMIPESGWGGFGPGAWQASFPYFSHVIGARAKGIWEHAHNDYLETIIDWGYLGAAGWAVVIFGGLARASVLFWRRRTELGDPERVTYFAVLSAMLGMLLHSLVDFPLQIASLQVSFAALLGVMWAAPHWLREAERPRPRRSHRHQVPVAETERSF